MIRIKKFNKKDFNAVMAVAKSLHPKWFDNYAIGTAIPLDLNIHKGFVAEDKKSIVGFITYTSISDEGGARISWIGVLPEFQSKGVGTRLVNKLEKELKTLGVKELRVGTVAASTKYEPYEKTRTFYKKMGFRVEKVKKMKSKDTGEKFDAATLIKNL